MVSTQVSSRLVVEASLRFDFLFSHNLAPSKCLWQRWKYGNGVGVGEQISFDGAQSRTYSFSARVDPVVGGTVSSVVGNALIDRPNVDGASMSNRLFTRPLTSYVCFSQHSVL